MDKRLDEIDQELREMHLMRQEIAWLRRVLDSIPITTGASGTTYTTLKEWLVCGRAYVKTYPVTELHLLDRHPSVHRAGPGVCTTAPD